MTVVCVAAAMAIPGVVPGIEAVMPTADAQVKSAVVTLVTLVTAVAVVAVVTTFSQCRCRHRQ